MTTTPTLAHRPEQRTGLPQGTLVEEAIWEAARAQAREILHDDDELRSLTTGVPDAEWNGIYRARPRPATPARDLVARATALFADLGLPFTWHLGPDTDPGIEAALQAAGLTFEEEEPGMLVALDHRHSGPPRVPANIELVPVSTAEQLDLWAAVLTGCGPAHHPLAEARRRAALDTGGAARAPHVLAIADGHPVGCAAVFLTGHGAVVDHVVTVPEARHRGIGTLLTAWALGTAHLEGQRTAVLTASPQGRGIYARMGFRVVSVVRRYRWTPR